MLNNKINKSIFLVVGIVFAFGAISCPISTKADPYPDSETYKSKLFKLESTTLGKVALESLFNALASNDLSAVKNTAISAAAKEVSSKVQNALLEYFPTLDFNLNYINDKFEGGALFVLPLYDFERDALFTQGSLFQKNDRTTVNIGVGYRYLALDERLLLGVNAFYDHEFPYNHARASIGLEARTSVGEVNSNIYHSLSDWKNAENSIEEKALGGYDFEIGIPLPYLNWAKFYARAFEWKSAIDGVKNIGGRDVRISMKLPFFDGMTVMVGHRDFKDQADEEFISVAYKFEFGKKKKSKRGWFNNKIYDMESMRENKFSKVRRENLIFKQKKSSGVLLIGGF